MTTHPVVEDLEVFADCRYCLATSLEMTMMNELLFEVPPETFRGGVVIAIASETLKPAFRRSQHLCDILRHSTGFPDQNDECNRATAF